MSAVRQKRSPAAKKYTTVVDFSYPFGLVFVLALNLLQPWPQRSWCSLSDPSQIGDGSLNAGAFADGRAAYEQRSASHHDFEAAEETPTRLNPQEGLPAATLPVPSLAAQAGQQGGRRVPRHPASAGGSAPPSALPPSRPCRPGMREGCHAT